MKRAPKPDTRGAAEQLCQQLDVDLISLATFVRRLERRDLDLRPVPEEALARLQQAAELVASARAVIDDGSADEAGERPNGLPQGATVLGSPMRLD